MNWSDHLFVLYFSFGIWWFLMWQYMLNFLIDNWTLFESVIFLSPLTCYRWNLVVDWELLVNWLMLNRIKFCQYSVCFKWSEDCKEGNEVWKGWGLITHRLFNRRWKWWLVRSALNPIWPSKSLQRQDQVHLYLVIWRKQENFMWLLPFCPIIWVKAIFLRWFFFSLFFLFFLSSLLHDRIVISYKVSSTVVVTKWVPNNEYLS